MLDNPLGEEKFPNIQSKPPLAQLEAISSCPITCYLGEETDPHLSTTSFQVVVESDEVSPQPPFLQAKQSQLPQLLLIRLLLQTLHQLRCPSLYTLQYVNIPLVVRGPKLNTVFEVRPHQCRVQGHNHFPSPAGHAIFDTSQDAIGLLGHLGTLLAHIQAAVNKHPQVLLCQAAFQPLFPKPVALHGVAVAQVQDLAGSKCRIHPSNPSLQFREKDVVGDRVKGFTEVQIDDIRSYQFSSTEAVFEGNSSLPVESVWSSPQKLQPLGLSHIRHLDAKDEMKQHAVRLEDWGKLGVVGWRLNHFPGQPVPMLDNPFSEVKFPNIQPKPPLAQLEAISSCPITCYLGEETNPHLSTTSFQTKQPQFPQLLLTGLVLQTLHQLCCPSLDMLQHLNVSLVVGGPKLNTVFEVRPHQCRVQGHDHFPSPAGHAIFDTSQDDIGLLGHLGTLLAHIQAAVNTQPQKTKQWKSSGNYAKRLDAGVRSA
ncbi:hypothetical protein QYF61_007410 [Mycteria americana]|uniref:Uncharacterized protein n=1 Tax=Mycteria americana TaxID=33587 RepID=A0AAN7S2T4_MYCAM|nr:hypothetical protein QYF61_007410 [Mycteria americana]